MDVVLLAVIGLVLLLGVVAVAVGHKGWSWGTVAAAILLLLASTGYLYLAARLAERERAWRALVAENQAKIGRIVGSNDPGGSAATPSLASLRNKCERWRRALAFVDTWHGRTWDKASLSPPREGRTGTISIAMPAGKSELVPLAAGAEVAVFDNAPVAEEGRFLGLFRVKDVKAVNGDENCLLTVVPAATPAPASAADEKLWTRNYDEVTVYESLPVDRWLAFHTTTDGAAGDPAATEGPQGAAAGGTRTAGRWMPQQRKIEAADPLKSLETQMEAVTQHDREVAENEWPKLGTKPKRDGTPRTYLQPPDGSEAEIMPGRYWADVTFTKNVTFTKKNGFVLDASGPVEPGSEADGEVGKPGATIGASIGEDPDAAAAGDAGGAGGAKESLPTAGAITNRFKLKRFKEGEQAEFDLQTALDLQDDKQFVKIVRVVERRPLTDPQTAIRGSEWTATTGETLRTEGLDGLRQRLLVEMTSIGEAMIRVASSRADVAAQAAAVAEETQQLTADQTAWDKDVTAAEQTADDFDARLRAVTIELAAQEDLIVRLGKELNGDWAVLTENIDAAAPSAR